MGIASSRAFKLGKARQPTLLPLIDLCNHSLLPNSRLETSADGTVRLISSQDIPADEAILIDYGPLPNTALLQDYGFIIENNPHDTVDLQLSIDHVQVCRALPMIPSDEISRQGNACKCIQYAVQPPRQLSCDSLLD